MTHRTIIYLFTFLIVSVYTHKTSLAQNRSGKIIAPIANLTNIGKGQLLVMLYKKIERIEVDPKTAFKFKKVKISSPNIKVTFDDIPYGEYAISILHDMNENMKMDTNWLGIPKEDLGSSNNIKGGPLGGPKWDKVKFKLDQPSITLQTIKISHLYD